MHSTIFHEEKVTLHSSVQRFFYYWCKTTWNWPISLKKSPVFPWVQVQGSQKPNLPHFPRLQGKMTVQTFLWVAIDSCICPGSPQGMADDRCINMFVFHEESGNKTLSNLKWMNKLPGFPLSSIKQIDRFSPSHFMFVWLNGRYRKFSDLSKVLDYSLFSVW